MSGLSFTSRIEGSEAGRGPERPAHPVTSPTARFLALAHYIEDAVESGLYGSAADVAHALGVTRARISQITQLLRLDPSTQEEILLGGDARTARALRSVCAEASWAAQQDSQVCGCRARPGPFLRTQ